MLSTLFRAQVITPSALPPSEQDQGLNQLCPVRALRIYTERSAHFRQSEQHFVCFGDRTKGSLVTKHWLSRWIIDNITLAYSSLGQQCPMGVKAHSTRVITLSWAWSSGVSIAEICVAAGWALPFTFARFYNGKAWEFRPYSPRSFMHNGLTLVIWQTSMGVCLFLVCSWP